MTRIHTVILVSCIVLLLTASDTIAAQETAATSAPTEATTATASTTASESSSRTTYYGGVAGGRAVRIISAEYVDGTAVLILELDLPQTVTVTAPTGPTSTGTAAEDLVHRPIPPGRTTIQIGSPEPRVTLVTSYSVENGRYIEIRFDGGGSTFIAGPFTGTDVRDAVIDGALNASFGTLLIIVRRRFGLHRDTERVT